MSLKLLVNSDKQWSALKEYLDTLEKNYFENMKSVDDEKEIYRLQGMLKMITIIRNLESQREE